MLNEYGDDSVAQLGGAHIACEGVSNVLTKVLEWGRLMAYLEQSTRYVPYTDRPNGRWKYHVPAEVERSPLADEFTADAGRAPSRPTRAGSRRWKRTSARSIPKAPEDSDGVYRSVIRAKALDTLRGLLPAATTSNVGLFGTGQAYEALLLRMFAHPLDEVRGHAQLMLAELRQVIPAFLARVDQPDRGGRWIEYLADDAARRSTPRRGRFVAGVAAEPRPRSRSPSSIPTARSRSSPRRSTRSSQLPDDQLLDDRAAHVGRRARGAASRLRRRPRATAATSRGARSSARSYRFDVLADYGAFRDLQRHRLLTLEWQPLSAAPRLRRAGRDRRGRRARRLAARSWNARPTCTQRSSPAGFDDAAPYAVVMAYRVRFYMDMNAREAMHVIELRTAPQGHPSYRRVCQQMHRAIADVAGHRAIAAAMQFADHSEVELERLQSERALEKKRAAAGSRQSLTQ